MRLGYAYLNTRDRTIYDALYKAIVSMEDECIAYVSDLPETTHQIDRLIFELLEAILRDSPDVFWVPRDYSFVRHADSISISLSYPVTREKKEEAQEQINAYVDWLAGRFADLSDYDYAVAVFEWLVSELEYIHLPYEGEPEQGNVLYKEEYETEWRDNTIYGAFLNRATRCRGYAGAFSVLMQRRNIPVAICEAQLDGSRHVWNIVRLDGVWCHVDVCWADRRESLFDEDVCMAEYVFFGMTEQEAV